MKFQQNRDIVLASGSPRRKDYLERYNLQFRIQTGDIDETPHTGETPLDFVERMAKEKAMAVIKNCTTDEIVIAADTIVVFDGKILGKPETPNDALRMLSELNGSIHQVITGYAIFDCRDKSIIQKAATTEVEFNQLSESFLRSYAATDEPHDKAGSYSIQGIGTALVKKINGSYNNVVGLPIEQLLDDLLRQNYLTIEN